MDSYSRPVINLATKLASKLNSALDELTKAIRETAETKNADEAPSPKVVVVNDFPKSIETHQSAEDTKHERRYKRWTLFVASLTLVAIVGYAVLVYLQYKEMIDATSAAQQAVQESRLNRRLSEKALNATVDQFKVDQRAWVYIMGVTLSKSYSESAEGQITIGVANSGKTPAINTAVSEYSFGADKPATMKRNPDIGRIVIAPGVKSNTMMLAIPRTPAKSTIYVHFVIEYWDVFGNRRTTTFCGYYPTGTPPYFYSCYQGGSMN